MNDQPTQETVVAPVEGEAAPALQVLKDVAVDAEGKEIKEIPAEGVFVQDKVDQGLV